MHRVSFAAGFHQNLYLLAMKVTLTGSLGRIGEPLTRRLVAGGHDVTVISSTPERRSAIEDLGARAAIGRLQDTEFLASTFDGADLAYVMAPPADYFDHSLDLLAYFKELGVSFAEAAKKAGVPRVLNLSSIGAHLSKGNGILEGTYYIERSLDDLPTEVSVRHLRPTSLYYNLYSQTPLIREHGIMGSNLAPETVNVWVAATDIAAVVAEEIATPTPGRSVRYIASEEATGTELARAIGTALGKPELPWVEITDEQFRSSLVGAGMNPRIAAGLTEMYAAIRSGLLYEHYREQGVRQFGPTKIADFAQTFARAYAGD